MAKCKFCGQGVRVAPVFHPSCWEQAVDKCEQCPMTRLKELGGRV